MSFTKIDIIIRSCLGNLCHIYIKESLLRAHSVELYTFFCVNLQITVINTCTSNSNITRIIVLYLLVFFFAYDSQNKQQTFRKRTLIHWSSYWWPTSFLWYNTEFWSLMSKLRKSTITFVFSSCVSSHEKIPLNGFLWNIIFSCFFFRKCVEKIQVLLKSEKNDRYYTRGLTYRNDNISLKSSWNAKCYRQNL